MTPGIYEFGPCQSVMVYGGRSGDIEQRRKKHIALLRRGAHHCAHLQNAWNKYGEDVFEFCVLEVIEDPVERIAAEQAWLDIHHANKTCYNAALNAIAPMEGRKHTGEARRKIGSRIVSNDERRATSERMMGNQYALGCTHSEEANREKSERVVSDATRSKMRAAKIDRKHTDEHRRNNSAAKTGERNPNWGKHPTKETRRKQSEAASRRWARKRAMEGLSLSVLIPNPPRPALLYGGYRK